MNNTDTSEAVFVAVDADGCESTEVTVQAVRHVLIHITGGELHLSREAALAFASRVQDAAYQL